VSTLRSQNCEDQFADQWLPIHDLRFMICEPFLLADDFRCTESGTITNIHIWGSWLADAEDRGATFVLSLHKDIPADPPLPPFSQPGDLVWLRIFTRRTIRRARLHEPDRRGMDEPPGVAVHGAAHPRILFNIQ
jgi:hypothetical protein